MSELEQLHKQLEKIAKSYVRKSIDGRELTPKQARAVAITKASTESPAGRQIARRIMQLEKQQAASFAFSRLSFIELSAGMRTIVLTVAISGAAAFLFPLNEERRANAA